MTTATMTLATMTSNKFEQILTNLHLDKDWTLVRKIDFLETILDTMFANTRGNELFKQSENIFQYSAHAWLTNMEAYRSIHRIYVLECVNNKSMLRPEFNINAVRLEEDCLTKARECMETIRNYLGN